MAKKANDHERVRCPDCGKIVRPIHWCNPKMRKMHYLAATSRVEADCVAKRQGWEWQNFLYVGSVEMLRGLAPNTNLYVYDGDVVRDCCCAADGAVGYSRGLSTRADHSRSSPARVEHHQNLLRDGA